MLWIIAYCIDFVSYVFTRLKIVGPFHILFGLLCVHALIMNVFFGHPTYWRQTKPKKSTSSDKLSVFCTNKTWDLERVHPDILVHIFGYLSPQELTSIAQVSRQYRALSHGCNLWNDLITRIPASLRDRHCELFLNDTAIHRYFKLLHIISCEILASNDKLIIKVHGDLYDLTHFAAEHPGGMAILEEYQGGDGTRIFDLAKHSEFARELSLNLVAFSPAEYTGMRGLPNFARHLQSIEQLPD